MDNQENSKENHHRQETAGGSSGRTYVLKLKFPKMPEEEEVKMESPAVEIPEAKIRPVSEEAARTHCCRECGRGFSSGKALGGHMSSAHVQANKDLSGKKPMRNKCNKSGGGCSNSSLANHICPLCRKSFPSKKSLFGHMRCHPDRDYRGMYRPLSPPSGHRKINSDEEDEYSSSDDQADSSPHEAAAAHPPQPPTVLIPGLKSWPSAAKRIRGGPIRPPSDSPPLSYASDDIALAHELVRMRLFKDIPFKEVGESSVVADSFTTDFSDENQLTVAKKQKGDDYDFVDRRRKNLRICERDDDDDDRRLSVPKKMEHCEGKGKEKVSPPLSFQPDDVIDSDDETCLIAINDLMNVKHVIESSKAAPPSPPPPQPAVAIRRSPIILQESGNSSSISPPPPKYTCDVCYRSFKSHQALGGHRSSHNKFKFIVVNTDDFKNGVNIKKEAATTHGNGSCNGTKVEDGDSSYVCEVCKKVFTSGQALGGHKRCHSSSSSSSSSPPAAEEESKKTPTKAAVFDFDLNESPPEPDSE